LRKANAHCTPLRGGGPSFLCLCASVAYFFFVRFVPVSFVHFVVA
jgi:hypothetical protein